MKKCTLAGLRVSALAAIVYFIGLELVSANIATIANPFTGDTTETWEEFSVGHIDQPSLTIFNGDATISGPNEYIWKTANSFGTPGGFGLGPFMAKAYDGNLGYGTSLAYGTSTITFKSPIMDFGGYWGCSLEGTSPITLNFYDQHGNLIGSSSFDYTSPGNNGSLEWQGWQSDTPIYSVSYSGAWVVDDSLRISAATVPDSEGIALLILSGLFLVSSRYFFRTLQLQRDWHGA